MAHKTFVPLVEIEQLEEGEFLADANRELRNIALDLVKFRKKHGTSSKKSKAKLNLTIEITVEAVDMDEERYSIKTAIKKTEPSRPAMASTAMEATDEMGRMTLVVRKSGSDEGNPRQRKLVTRDGRTVDHETGIADGEFDDGEVHSAGDDGEIDRG